MANTRKLGPPEASYKAQGLSGQNWKKLCKVYFFQGFVINKINPSWIMGNYDPLGPLNSLFWTQYQPKGNTWVAVPVACLIGSLVIFSESVCLSTQPSFGDICPGEIDNGGQDLCHRDWYQGHQC